MGDPKTTGPLDLFYTNLRKPPLVSVAEAWSYQLSPEDKEAVKSTMESDGWKVLVNRVWMAGEYICLHNAARRAQAQGLSYYQGVYEGYKLHEELANRAVAKVEERKRPERRRSPHRFRQPSPTVGDA